MSLVAARMISLATEMVVLAVESRDHVKVGLAWVIVLMCQKDCKCSKLGLRVFEFGSLAGCAPAVSS